MRALPAEPTDQIDSYGRLVRVLDGVPGKAEVTFLAWTGQAAIYDVVCEEGDGSEVELWATELLVNSWESVPRHLTHASIRTAATLRWYATSPWGRGAVLCGILAGHTLYYDTLDSVDLAWFNAIRPGDGTQVVVMGDAQADHRLQQHELTPTAIGARLRSEGWMGRMVTLRALARFKDTEPALVVGAHHYSLLDSHYTVRHFAAVQLGGIFQNRAVTTDIAAHLHFLADPFPIWQRFGLRDDTWDGKPFRPAVGRRNGRLAILWVLGHLAQHGLHRAEGPENEALRDVLLPAVKSGIETLDDSAIQRAAWAERMAPEPSDLGLGTASKVKVTDALRFLEYRAAAVRGASGERVDKFAWLDDTVEVLVRWLRQEGVAWPPGPSEDGPPEPLPDWLSRDP